jgi:hypothetical protein
LDSFCRKNDIKFSSGRTVTPHLVLCNNFDGSPHVKLAGKTLQGMFPPVNAKNFNFSKSAHVALFNYNEDDETIDFRCYKILREKEENTQKTKIQCK